MPDSTGDEYGFHIARVWQAVRDHRNDFWHPDRRPGLAFPFMAQTLVTPAVLALRMVHALVAARLIELGYAPEGGELADDIVAIKRWIATLEPTLEAGLKPVSDPPTMMERRDRGENAERGYWTARSDASFERAAQDLAEKPG